MLARLDDEFGALLLWDSMQSTELRMNILVEFDDTVAKMMTRKRKAAHFVAKFVVVTVDDKGLVAQRTMPNLDEKMMAEVDLHL